NSALLKTRTYLGLLTPCLALHGSQRMIELLEKAVQMQIFYL
ncbi:hypothetical protein K661_01409, partial [Piscirickettsia salmonis LF-89 = ATCC VR-1361]